MARLTSENVSRSMARGAISMPILRMVSAQNPASSKDAKRQVIHRWRVIGRSGDSSKKHADTDGYECHRGPNRADQQKSLNLGSTGQVQPYGNQDDGQYAQRDPDSHQAGIVVTL